MIIEPSHFKYLVTQRGEVADQKDDFTNWKAAYEASLNAIMAELVPVLPDPCNGVLDIGSGLGGVDALLAAHYGSSLRVRLLDGEEDPPEVRMSCIPHNSMAVAKDFLTKNGVKDFGYYTPGAAHKLRQESPFDLVVSFVAYGFHFRPDEYLTDLQAVVHDKTKLIFDVRRTKTEWLRDLVKAFGKPKVLSGTAKSVRVAFRC